MLVTLALAGPACATDPDVAVVTLRVVAPPDEIEQRIAAPMERALHPLGAIRTRIDDGSVELTLDSHVHEEVIRDALARVAFPAEAQALEVTYRRVHPDEVFVACAAPWPAGDPADALGRLPAVADVAEVCGGGEQLAVVVDPVRAAAAGQSVAEILAAVAAGAREPLPSDPLPGGVLLGDLATVERGPAPTACATHGAALVARLDLIPPGRVAIDGRVRALAPKCTVVTNRTVLELRRDPQDAKVGDAVARAVGGIVLDGRDGRARVLVGPDNGDAALATIRAIPGVAGAWDPADVRRLRITGPAWDELDLLADQIALALRNVPGATAYAAEAPPRRSVDVEVDATRASARGLDPREVAAAAAAWAGSLPVRASWPTPVVVRVASGAELAEAVLPSPTGPVSLGEVARFHRDLQRTRVRYDGVRTVELVVEGASLDALDAAIATVSVPEGYRVAGVDPREPW